MRSKILIVFLSFFSFSAFADIVSEQVKIQTKFYSTDYDTLNATYYGPDGSLGWSHGGYVSTSSVKNVEIVPGKEYYVVLYGIDPTDTYNLYLQAPDGYTLEIAGPQSSDYKIRTQVTNQTMGYSAHTYRFKISRAIGSAAGGFGEATSVSHDKPVWEIDLGALQSGRSAGRIRIAADDLDDLDDSPADLIYVADSPEVEVVKSGGDLRQVYVPQGLADITTINSTTYQIKIYGWSQVGSWNGSTYNVSGTPVVIYKIAKLSSPKRFDITKTIASVSWTTRLQESGSTMTFYDWVKSSDPTNSLRKVETVISSGSPNETRTTTVYGKEGSNWVASERSRRTYTTYGSGGSAWGPVLTELIVGYNDSNTTSATTEYEYYTSSGDAGSYRQVKSVERPDGGLTLYEYYSSEGKIGLLKKLYEPFENTNPSLGSTAGKVTEYQYSSSEYDGERKLTSVETKISNNTVRLVDYTPSNASSSVLKTEIEEYYYDQADSANLKSLVTTTWSYKNSVSTDYLRGKPYAVENPDGSKVRYQYFTSGGDLVSRVYDGFSADLNNYTATAHPSLQGPASGDKLYVVEDHSTMEESVTDAYGRVESKSVWVCESGYSYDSMSSTTYSYDSSSNLTNASSGGNTLYSATFADGRIETETDQGGAVKEFEYDEMERLERIVEKGKGATSSGGSGYETAAFPDRITEMDYDGSNNVVERRVMESPSGETITSSFDYDFAGRLIEKTMDCCDTVEYIYDPGTATTYTFNADNTSADPADASVIERRYLDGSLRYRKGPATVPQYVMTRVMTPTKQITVQTSQEEASIIGGTPVVDGRNISRYDWLGRQTSEAVINDEGYSTIKVFDYEDDTGRLVARHLRKGYTSYPILAPYRFKYNELGQMELEGMDVDNDGVIEGASSDDRTSKRVRDFYKDGSSRWWTRVQEYAFPTYGSTGVLVSESRSRVTPVSGELSRAYSKDSQGNVTESWTEVDASNGFVISKSQLKPESANPYNESVSLSKLGMEVYRKDVAGNETTFKYDDLWRLEARVGRGGVYTEYDYENGTRRIASVWNRNGGSGGYEVRKYTYEDGRIESENRRNNFGSGAFDQMLNYEYNQRGQVTSVTGDGSFPVAYEYDDYGRLVKQIQTRDTSSSKTTVTEWGYNGANGLVKSKKHAGSSTYEEYYDYNAMHALKKRELARGVYTEYVYSYDSATSTGDLKEEVHSDSHTPEVEYRSYDRMGRPTEIADYTGGVGTDGSILTSTESRNLVYTANGGLSLYQENLTSFYGSDFTHSYETAGSNKVDGRYSGFAYDGVSWSQGYDSQNGRIASVSNSGAGGETFTYGYESDSNHVTSVTVPSAYQQYRAWENHRENFVSSTTKWNGSTRAQYTTISLNWQYQTRQYQLGNSDSASLGSKIRAGSGSGAITYTTGYDKVGQVVSWDTSRTAGSADRSYDWDEAGNPESYAGTSLTPNNLNQLTQFGYDSDGNLTSDGTWTYFYDANNRLWRMYKTGKSLEFKYDYLGRRVDKKVWNQANMFSGTPAKHVKFAYQGMELVAELDDDGDLLKTFHWGLDLSDTRGGSGGAMGLVTWRDHTSNESYYPAYDLNGNLTGLLGDDGLLKAWYEYDAFGMVLTRGGENVASDIDDDGVNETVDAEELNPIRFSTQYVDEETGLVYYGFRFYDPSKGRFLNRDPIGEAGGVNLYRMVGNDPVNRLDKWGLRWIEQCTGYLTETVFDPFTWSIQVQSTGECAGYDRIWIPDSPDEINGPGQNHSNNRQNGNSGNQNSNDSDAPQTGDTPQKENEWDKKKCKELLAQANKDYTQEAHYRNRHRVLARKLPGVDHALVGKTVVSAIANIGSSMGALTPENIVSVGQMASKGSKSGAMARNLAANMARNLRGPGVSGAKILGPLDIAGSIVNHGIDIYNGQFSLAGAALDAGKLAATRIYGSVTLVGTALPDMLKGHYVKTDTNMFMNHEDGFEAQVLERLYGGKVDAALEILNGPCKEFLD